MKNYIAIPAIVAALALGSTSGAVAGSMITGKDIKNNTVASRDIKDGSLKFRDLHPKFQSLLLDMAGKNGAPGKDGKDGSVAGVQTNWEEKDGSEILDAHSVRLTSAGTPAGASVQIFDLNLPVQAMQTIEFTYALEGGAVYGAGSPRIFIEVSGAYENTHDAAPSDAGVDNGDGTFTKTYTISKNGRVGEAGVVYDNPAGLGSIVVSDVKIGGQSIKFKPSNR